MYCTPKADTASVRRWIFLLMAVGVAAFLVPTFFPVGQALPQTVGVLSFGAGLFLTARYMLTSFTYGLLPRGTGIGEVPAFAGTLDIRALPLSSVDFTVSRQKGRGQPVLEACLSLSDLTGFYLLSQEKDARRRELSAHSLARIYSYTVSFRPERTYLARFCEGDEEIGILFEPSEEMAAFFMAAATRNNAE